MSLLRAARSRLGQITPSLLARSVALNIAGQVAVLLVGFASSVALARGLGPADRGLLGIMSSVVNVVLAVAGLGLPFAVAYYASRRKAKTDELLGNNIAYAAVLALVFVPAFWLLHGSISDALARGRGGLLWALAAVMVPLSFLNWTLNNQLVGQLRFFAWNALGVLSKLVMLAGVVALVLVAGLGVKGGLAAMIAAELALIVGPLAILLRNARPRFDRGLFRATTSYGLRVQVGTIFQIVNYRLDVIVAQFFLPLRVVGYYVVAEFIAELVVTVSSSFGTSILPLVSHYEGTEDQRATTIAAIRHHGVMAALGTAVNAVFGPLLIFFAYGRSFHGAIVPMLILLPGMWFLGTGAVVGGALRGRGRPGLASTVAGVAVLFTVALDLALIPPFGITGAAVASVIAYSILGLVSLATLSRVSGIPVRTLVVPTAADLRRYPAAIRSVFAPVGPSVES